MNALAPFRGRNWNQLANLDNFFDELAGRFFSDAAPSGEGFWVPPMDVAHNEDEVTIRSELPGMSADDVDISVQGNTLTISGEKKETQEGSEDYYHRETRYGTFRRSLTLPADVDTDKVEAACKDGVLTVKIPKSEKAKPRKISVKHE